MPSNNYDLMERTTRRNHLAKQLHRLVFAGVLGFLLTSIATSASDDNNAVPLTSFGSFDGDWQFSITGCQSSRVVAATIRNGKITFAVGAGVVSPDGTLDTAAAGNGATLMPTGNLSGATGNRTYKLSNGCTGTWTTIDVSNSQSPPSSPDEWIQAGTSTSDNWSREALLSQILGRSKVETREQVGALLGPPNYTVEEYSAGQGITHRFDTYRLSAKNDRSYNITYEPSGEIQHQGIENWRCGCPICEKAAKVANAALSSQTVSGFLATLKGAPSVQQMLSAIELSVGNQGVRTIDLGVRRGGQFWAFYWVTWPIADDDHRFFMASGSMPMVNYSRDKDLPIDSYSLIAVTNECLGRDGDEIPNPFAPR
jgi:hypothetical protein